MRLALPCVSLLASAAGCVPTFDDNLPLVVKPTLIAVCRSRAGRGAARQAGAIERSHCHTGAPSQHAQAQLGVVHRAQATHRARSRQPGLCSRAPSQAPKDIVDLEYCRRPSRPRCRWTALSSVRPDLARADER